jgi:hypothetical protein
VPIGESPDGGAAPAQPVVGVSTVVTLQSQGAAVVVDTGDEAGLFRTPWRSMDGLETWLGLRRRRPTRFITYSPHSQLPRRARE